MVRKLLGYEYGIISTELAIIHYNRCKKNIRNVLICSFVWCWYCSLLLHRLTWRQGSLNAKLQVNYRILGKSGCGSNNSWSWIRVKYIFSVTSNAIVCYKVWRYCNTCRHAVMNTQINRLVWNIGQLFGKQRQVASFDQPRPTERCQLDKQKPGIMHSKLLNE